MCLPKLYKQYLIDVGAGTFTRSRVTLLEDWAQPYGESELPSTFLAQAFPHHHAWNDRDLLEIGEGWKSPYFDPLLFRGSMRIVNTGCEEYYLLVVSGEESGNVWVDDRVPSGTGIYPLQGTVQDRVTIGDYLYGANWSSIVNPFAE